MLKQKTGNVYDIAEHLKSFGYRVYCDKGTKERKYDKQKIDAIDRASLAIMFITTRSKFLCSFL